ncbi:glycoside hydrolase family 2 protein [Pedobacter cryoconitis]|uniref:Beta-galactosidase n=1 Tax=Pedobacter cryoconitis TaxID=188932 RepID=A0A7X0MKH4_9SPHI|nr:glycoside hydrolase family 2 TIM barrel-domain containing protein [Pedobacter cryoconitis]MBB6500705.1 beta-galactosidase [Pedobacter cryoconitis]
MTILYFNNRYYLAVLLFLLTGFSVPGFAQSRKNISFNQDWTFRKTNDTINTKSVWEKVTLPHTWNAIDMQLGKDFYEGEGQYKKEVVFGPEYKNKRLFLRFEGVGQVAQVYVNHKLVGTHKGSYSAFCLDITYAVKLGESNSILVKVNNKARKDIIPVNHFLFGIYGGIYRPVSLLVTNKVNITTTDYASPGIYISQKNVTAKSAEVSVAVKIENTEKSGQDIDIKTDIIDHTGKIVSSKTSAQHMTTQGRQQFSQDFQLTSPHLWNGFNDPYLYKVRTQLLLNQTVIDEVEQPLGLRKFEIIAGKGFFLNDQPYAMHGVCRHQDRWQYGNALSNAQHKEDLDIIKEMGATTIRFAHYQQAEYLYSTCDTMGFVIWAEIPFVNTSTGEEADNAKQQLMELIKQNYNHPSIYVWGLHNEVYGKTPADFPAVLTRDLNDIAKTEDPYRYTVSVSGYGEMDRPTNLNADIQGMNRYYGWYEGKIGDLETWAKTTETIYPDNKLILTEYGADGNIFQQQEQADLKEEYDYTSPFYPENFETKTHEIQWPIIAKHPYITASYIWNMFDFATPMWNRGSMPARNMKGLVTFDRKLKKDAFYWYKANWSKEPVLYLTERRTTARKHAVTPVTVYSNIGQPVLYVNDKKISAAPVQGTNAVQYIFKDIQLKKGINKIKTVIKKDNKIYTDHIDWSLQ